MILRLLLVATFLVNSALAASDKKETKEAPSSPEVRSVMVQFLGHILNLKTFLVSEKRFSQKKNEKTIEKELLALKNLAQTSLHEQKFNAPGMVVSKEVLEHHINETYNTFKKGNKSYARWMLNGTFSICVSCHTQSPAPGNQSWAHQIQKSFPNKGEQAEFLFLTRNFDDALKIFNERISGPGRALKTDELDQIMERKLMIFVRIRQNPGQAIDSFQEDLKSRKIPKFLKAKIKQWIVELEEWKKEPPFAIEPVTETAFKSKVESLLEKAEKVESADLDRKSVIYLRLSGLLSDFSNKHPKTKLTPEILYWMAKCDRHLKQNFFYSLGDLYLKECMKSHAKHAVAKKCFQDYEENTILSYSGSGGTHLPEDVKKELDALRKEIAPELPPPQTETEE